MSMESTLNQIARIIAPEAMRQYEANPRSAPTWDQLVAFSTVKIARHKAAAIIALLLPAPICTEDDGTGDPVYPAQMPLTMSMFLTKNDLEVARTAGNYSDQDDPRTNPHPK